MEWIEKNIITTSGDRTAVLWDVEKGVATQEFAGHKGDVMR